MWRNLNKHVKNGLQAGSLMAVGDVISQVYVENSKLRDLNLYRTVKFGALGTFFVGPVLGAWYGVLERRILFQNAAAKAVGKMACDQLIFAPFFLYNFLWVNGLTSLKPTEKVKEDVHKNYYPILVSNYKVWPAVQLLNFWIVPLQYRILFVQSVAVFWNTYLSWMTHKTM